MVFVENNGPSDCIFCEAPASRQDEQKLILYRGRSVFIQMNLYPYNPGHVMIAPYRHLGELQKLSADEQFELIQEATKSTTILRETMNADGFNLGMNLGKVAGAGVEHHLHLHVVPRWNGDTNFMPLIAETKVIPEALSATYRKLAPVFGKTA
jgi:ATP adenylyltransferase